jgi:EAL domain-containing protein (putative c-di-GMP-specific phosphodiesterase class I)
MSLLAEKMAAAVQRRPVPDDLGRALLSSLSACRPLILSLHDAAGDTLWLSAGSIGPDEQSFVLAALDVFALEPHRCCIHRKLEDGRRALFLAARDPLGACCGVGFAIVEGGVIDDTRVVTPAIRTLLQRFSVLLAPAGDKRASLPASAPAPAPAAALAAEADGAGPLEFPDHAPIRARGYKRLQPGTGIRRYEISIAPVGAQHDATVFERVVDWLVHNRQRYAHKPSSFAVPISAAAALDRGFAARVEACLGRHELDEGLLMLVVPAAAWSAQSQRLRPLLEMCERRHCRVVLDDFQLNDVALQLLRSKAVRMLKLSTELTVAAMQERYPRALLSACAHIARVLGIHCVAKRVDSPTATRWLAAAGVDYIDPSHGAESDPGASSDRVGARKDS